MIEKIYVKRLKWVMVSTKWPTFMAQCANKFKVFVTLQKGQEKVKVKTTGLVHNFIILANCWTMIEGKSETAQ